MNGYDLREVLDLKCETCLNDKNCKIKDGFILVSNNFKQNAVNNDYIKKINYCLFFRKKNKIKSEV